MVIDGVNKAIDEVSEAFDIWIDPMGIIARALFFPLVVIGKRERMSNPDIYTDIAESILEHAAAITRLDAHVMGDAAYQAAYASRVHAMRLVAVAHVDPQPDRELVRKLRTLSGNFPGVFVQLADGAIRLIVDTASKQHKFNLWTRQQLLKNEEEDDFMDH